MEKAEKRKMIVPSRIYEYYSGGCFPATAMVDYVSQVGFDGIDMSLESMERHGEAYRAVFYSIANRAAALGLDLPMCHLPFYMPDPGKAALMEKFSIELKRGIDGAALMGIPLAVTHPIALRADTLSFEDWLRANIRFLYGICRYAEGKGVTVCIENMASRHERAGGHLYGVTAEEILCVAAAVGAQTCWDTGHANICGIKKQSEEILRLGERLCCVHLHDNDGVLDRHLLPFDGTVDWDDVAYGLSYVGYRGALDLEVKSSELPPQREVRLHFGARTLECGERIAEKLTKK